LRKPLFALAALVLLAGCAETALPMESVGAFKDDPKLSIVSPTEGQTIQGANVTVQLATTGKFKVVPPDQATTSHLFGEGHFHLFLDVAPTAPGNPVPKGVAGIYHVASPTFVLSGVTSGRHTLWVELGFSDHVPYQNTLTKVDFTVVDGAAPGSAPAASAAPSAAPSAEASPSPSAAASGPVAAKVQLVADPTNGGAFNPPTVSIKVGQAVEWDWVDTSAQHSSTADDGTWDSGLAGAGNTYSFTFTKAGSYPYHCSVHPNMKGTVTVS
jgi:plastocyanin